MQSVCRRMDPAAPRCASSLTSSPKSAGKTGRATSAGTLTCSTSSSTPGLLAPLTQAKVQRLRELKDRTHLAYNTLCKRAAVQYNLETKLEKFKIKRKTAPAQMQAAVLSGERGMLEFMSTHGDKITRDEQDKPKASAWHSNIVMEVPHDAAPRQRSDTQRQQRQSAARSSARQQLSAGHTKVAPFKFTKDSWQITACIDGGSTWLRASKSAGAHEVYYEVRHTQHACIALLHILPLQHLQGSSSPLALIAQCAHAPPQWHA